MEAIIAEYYKNNASKLRRMANKIISKEFGKLADKDYQDFYSLANEVFLDVIRRYDGVRPFGSFLYSCLSNKFKTEMTKKNRNKRKSNIGTVSIDCAIRSDSETTLKDCLVSDFDIEKECMEDSRDNEDGYSQQMLEYLSRLSHTQRSVLNYLADGYSSKEIIAELGITTKEYNDCCDAIHSYSNVSILLSEGK